MDHLACFLPGVLALGSVTTDDKERAERDMKVAKVKPSSSLKVNHAAPDLIIVIKSALYFKSCACT